MFEKKTIILVSGSNGQLGKEFRKWATEQSKFEFLFTSRDTMDISKKDEVIHIFKKFRPDYCINCAAYTAVDQAEEEVDKAFLINESGLGNLIDACHTFNCKLFNYSTDYVYDSINDRPLLESDPCHPKSIYGQSKRAGELLLEKSNIQWVNIRVSWLYSSFNKNFVKTMLRLGVSKAALTIVSDQIGSPTYSNDLAGITMAFINSNKEEHFGHHYNFSNEGETNWCDFAAAIFEETNIPCVVSETTTEAYGAPAPRPLWSVLSKEKIKNALGIEIRSWRTALQSCLKELK